MRHTFSARSTTRSPSSGTTSSGANRTVESFGPPWPCSRFVVSWPRTKRTSPPGATASSGRSQRPHELVARQLRVQHGDEVEGAPPGLVLEDVGDDPFHVHAATRRQVLALAIATSAEKSTPVTRQPRSASQTAFRPSRRPRSSARRAPGRPPPGRTAGSARPSRPSSFRAYRSFQSSRAKPGRTEVDTGACPPSRRLQPAGGRLGHQRHGVLERRSA